MPRTHNKTMPSTPTWTCSHCGRVPRHSQAAGCDNIQWVPPCICIRSRQHKRNGRIARLIV